MKQLGFPLSLSAAWFYFITKTGNERLPCNLLWELKNYYESFIDHAPKLCLCPGPRPPVDCSIDFFRKEWNSFKVFFFSYSCFIFLSITSCSFYVVIIVLCILPTHHNQVIASYFVFALKMGWFSLKHLIELHMHFERRILRTS